MTSDEAGTRDSLDDLEALFFQVLEQPPGEREVFLDRVCGHDQALRSTLQQMLKADQDKAGLIDAAPWSVQQIGERIAAGSEVDPLARPGAQIGPYRLIDVLGTGGMGAVWRARRTDGLAERIVAIKFIPLGMNSQSAIRRFRQEEQALARLEHPYIARLYDSGATEQGRPYLVMEYVEGLALTEYARRNGLSLEERLGIVRKVCEAVQYAHGCLVLHRDLKPGNILINSEGTPKLLDFGIAKLLDDSATGAGSVTVTDLRILTPRYASPEQIRGEQLSVATDVYSLGVILYELVVDRSPYQVKSGTRHELEHAVLEQPITRPSSAIMSDPSLPPGRRRSMSRRIRGEIDAICLKALNKSPLERYRSVFELGEDIRRHLQGIPLLARPPSLAARVVRGIRKRRAWIATALVGAALGIGLAALFVVRTFLVPGWQSEHIRRARLAIVGDNDNSSIYNYLFYDPKPWRPQHRVEDCLPTDRAEIAAEEYASAIRLGDVDERVSMESAMLRLLLAGDEASRELDDICSSLPDQLTLTRKYVGSISDRRERPTFGEKSLQQATSFDLRCLGLISLLMGDPRTTIECWTRMTMTQADPLVECLLGHIHLALDEPDLAYPRLLSAYRTYPESGTIALYLADAAIRCGDISQASHCMEVAERLRSRDRNFGQSRVRMLIHLEKGEQQDALDLYCTGFCHRNIVADLQVAKYFERIEGVESAIRAIAGRINPTESSKTLERATFEYFVNLMEAWWSQCDASQREALIRGLDARDSFTRQEFEVMLHRYQYARREMSKSLASLANHVAPGRNRGRWARLIRYTDEGELLAAREELLALADEMPSFKWISECAQQCRPWNPTLRMPGADTHAGKASQPTH